MRPLVRLITLLALSSALVAPGQASAAPVDVQLTAPAIGSVHAGLVVLRASALGADSVTFQFGHDAEGPFQAVGLPDTTSGDGWKTAWNSAARADGSWFLRARADAGGGSSLSDPIPIGVDNTAPAVSVSASPGAFSPNGDRVRDRVIVTAKVSEPSALRLTLTRRGAPVHVLSDGAHVAAGVHRFEWRGLVSVRGHWRRAGDGPYAVRAVATDDAGNHGLAAGSVRVDTRAPGFRWRDVSPEPAPGTRPVTLSFESFDPGSRLAIKAAIWNHVKRVAFADGLSRAPGRAAVRITPSSPPPGLYRARLVLVDQAGNKTVTPFRAFRIQRPVHTTVVRGFSGVGNRVALTFDDCAFGDAWTSILNSLEARGLRATFFCASSTLRANAAQARRTVADGMSIGSHTRDHPVLTTLSYAQIRAQLQADIDAWWRIARATPLPMFRPPYGAYDSEVLRAAGDLGFTRTVVWDVDPADWSDPGVAAIRQRVLSHSHPGMVVVMHVKPETAAALPGLLDALAARGLRQTPIEGMFRAASGPANLRLGPAEWGRHGSG
jgi:peptidoglycan/xylan/chitin deacetylase (PgdA/CDA1 family)